MEFYLLIHNRAKLYTGNRLCHIILESLCQTDGVLYLGDTDGMVLFHEIHKASHRLELFELAYHPG